MAQGSVVALRCLHGHHWESWQYADKQVPEQSSCGECGALYARKAVIAWDYMAGFVGRVQSAPNAPLTSQALRTDYDPKGLYFARWRTQVGA